MVLAGDEHAVLLQVPDGVVAAPVSVGQAAGLGAGGQGQQLVAHAHAEDGDGAVIELAQLSDDLSVLSGITGAVGEHHAVKAAGEHLAGGGVGGQGHDLTAAAAQALDDVLLHAVVHHGHQVRFLAIGVKHLGLGPGHPADGIFHLIGAQPLHDLGHIKMLRTGEHTVHAPLTAEYFRQCPGVHALDAGNIVFLQIGVQIALTAEIAAPGGQMTDHEGLHPGTAGLVILVVDAVIADEGIGHHHALSGIGGVGQDLLIAGHRGVEHHLADPVGGAADAGPGKNASVGQDQSRFHQFSHTPSVPGSHTHCFRRA